MTSSQTIDGVLVSRELLDKVCNGYAQEQGHALNELRALLDAPAQCAHEFESPVLSSMPDYCAKCSIDKPAEVNGDDVLRWMDEHAAAQPQGEPVAWMFTGLITVSSISLCAERSGFINTRMILISRLCRSTLLAEPSERRVARAGSGGAA